MVGPRVYLDHAATTRVRPEVQEVMSAALAESYGNPSSVHREGQRARKCLEEAREQIASLLCCGPSEILFTSGGTESDNLAIKGSIADAPIHKRHIITSSIEHPAVLESCRVLEQNGARVTCLPVSRNGLISLDSLSETLSPDTYLVSVMLVNNEIGTVEPIADLCRIAHERGVLFHTDAVQAVGMLPVRVRDLGVDMLSLSSHKFGGPKGVGILVLKKDTAIRPILDGGSQEMQHRAGTENLPAIIGMAEALERAVGEMDEVTSRVRSMKERLVGELKEAYPNVHIHADSVPCHPGIVNFYIPGMEGEKTMLLLDYKGFAVSGGAACASKEHTISHVLSAIGCEKAEAENSIRISLGGENTEEEIHAFVEALKSIVLP